MYKAREDNKHAIERALKALDGLERGATWTHSEATQVLWCEPPSPRYYSLMQRVKREFLASKGIKLVASTTVGWTLLDPKGQVANARHEGTVRAARRVRSASRTVGFLPDEVCDMPVQRARMTIQERLEGIERELRHQSRLMTYLLKPTTSVHGRDDERIAKSG